MRFMKEKPLAEDVKLSELAEMTEGYVGADIEGICREAAMLALREIVTPGADRKNIQEKAAEVRLSKRHFEKAIRRVKPTTSRETLSAYEKSAELFARYATEFEEESSEEKIRKSRSKKKIRKPGSKKRFLRKRYPDFLQADKTLFDQPVNSGTLIFARKRAASLIENFIDLSSTHLRNSIRIT